VNSQNTKDDPELKKPPITVSQIDLKDDFTLETRNNEAPIATATTQTEKSKLVTLPTI